MSHQIPGGGSVWGGRGAGLRKATESIVSLAGNFISYFTEDLDNKSNKIKHEMDNIEDHYQKVKEKLYRIEENIWKLYIQ